MEAQAQSCSSTCVKFNFIILQLPLSWNCLQPVFSTQSGGTASECFTVTHPQWHRQSILQPEKLLLLLTLLYIRAWGTFGWAVWSETHNIIMFSVLMWWSKGGREESVQIRLRCAQCQRSQTANFWTVEVEAVRRPGVVSCTLCECIIVWQVEMFSYIDSEVLQRATSLTFSCRRPAETFLAWRCILAIKMPPEMKS